MHPKLERGRPRLSFYLYLAHRVNIAAHPGMAILTILAVAAATALAVGVEIASRAVREELHDTARAILGNADLEVVAGNRGIPEALIEKVASVPGVSEASPVITEVVRVVGGPLDGLALNVLGIDLLAAGQMREASVTRERVTVRDPLRLLVKPNSIVIAASLAERLRVREGESFRINSPVGGHDVVVEGLIERGGLGDAYGGQIGVMDVWALQHLLRARGYVDRVEVTVAPDHDPDALLPLIQSRAAGIATTRHVIERESWAATWLGVLDLAAWAAAGLSAIVAALLAYTAISHVVDSRMQDFALMQCAGMDHRGVQLLVFVDGLLLSGIGGIAGLLAGVAASPLILTAFSGFSDHLQQIQIKKADVDVVTLLAGVLVCLAVAALASIPHALRARTSHPLDLLSAYERRPNEGTVPERTWAAILVCTSAVLLLWLASSVPPAIRLAGMMVAGLGGIGILGMRMLAPVTLSLRSLLGRVAPALAFVGTSLPPRSAPLAASLGLVATVMFAAAMLIVVVETLVESMGAEIAARYGDGAVVRSIPSSTPIGGPLILPQTILAIRTTPGVKEVAEYYDADLMLRGDGFLLRAFDSEALFRNATMLEDGTPVEQVRSALARGEVVMSRGFGRWFGVDVGDNIVLDTPSGSHTFRIGGTAPGFTDRTGGLLIGIRTFDRHFPRGGASFLGIWADGPLPATLDEVARRTAGAQVLFFASGGELRRTARRIADRFGGLLYALLALAGFLAAIGVLTVTATAIVARGTELALMQIVGAAPRSIAGLVFMDSLVLAAVGAIPGGALGVLSADVVAELFEISFGWSLGRHVPPGKLAAASAALIACAAAAGLGPAWVVSRRELAGALPHQ